VGELLNGAIKDDSLGANPDLQKTVDERGEVEEEVTSGGVTIDNGKQRAGYRWPEICKVRLMGGYLESEDSVTFQAGSALIAACVPGCR